MRQQEKLATGGTRRSQITARENMVCVGQLRELFAYVCVSVLKAAADKRIQDPVAGSARKYIRLHSY